MSTTTHKLVAIRCPNCSATFEAVEMDGSARPPTPGDTTVCIDCGASCFFNHDMSLREITFREYLAMPGYAQVDLIRTWNLVNRRIQLRIECGVAPSTETIQ